MINQFPLTWPAGWRRTQHPQYSKFKPGSAYAETIDVERQLALMGASHVVVSSNMQYRPDGLPYARQGNINDTGVAVYFTLNGEDQCIPCDKWVRIEDNIRAVSKTIEALRGIERWGAKEMVNAAFRGFKALPAGVEIPLPTRNWWEVLGVNQGSNALEVKAAYRDKLKLAHPDTGGSQAEFEELQKAYKQWMEA